MSPSDGLGGAVYNTGTAEIADMILSQNSAVGPVFFGIGSYGGVNANGWGGAIYNTGLILLTNVSLASNSTSGQANHGQVIYNTGAIVADSTSVITPTPYGTPPLTCQWQWDGTNISGTTNPTFSLANVQFNDSATYGLVLSNSSGVVTNLAEILSDPVPVAPVFDLLPVAQTVWAGSTLEMQAAAVAVPAPVYQWLVNGTNLSGATGSLLVFSNAQVAQSGSYSIVVSNSTGSITSQPVVVTVASVAAPLVTGAPMSGSPGFQLQFAGTHGAGYSVWASTNLINWVRVGASTETSSGDFQFTDTSTSNPTRRFYQIRWP